MKLIIAGGRDVTEFSFLKAALMESGYWKQYGKSIEVVCGMAKGADLLGKKFAEKNGLVVYPFPADWETYGNRAGPIRNAEMGAFAKKHEGALLALWDGKSKGTKNMIDWAVKNALTNHVYMIPKETE
jgi:hypothetical protein